ncbi:hypothetical protein CERSUDRAFT_116772 [Gelatoporia subvermispora B]|uniref:Uncharacterized protein n=1 Tax=Ceriporiopsis subvermispora (strain B) TaxID=914234 RepID=M2QC77_CERS8|nr:hypothetical protein CERSUDRAFT_116772 [Gelatoporia subvermispora B]
MSDFELGYTLSNTSPLLNFGPSNISSAAGSAQSGWQINASFVYTSVAGATLQLPPFYGDAVSIYGSTGWPFNVTVDGQTTSHPLGSGVIFQQNLTQGTHNVSLVVGPSTSPEAEFVFEYATLSSTYALGEEPVEVTYEALSDPLVYNGNWTFFPNNTAQTSMFGASMSLNFSGVAVAVTGPSGTSSSAGAYTVILDSAASFISNNTVDVSETQIFYQAGLDPTAQHTITLINSDTTFAFDSISVWGPAQISSASGSTSTSHNDIVKIVVPIVAVLAALLILASAFLLRRRRRQRRRNSTLSGPFAMRLSRSFGKTSPNAVILDNLGRKQEVAEDATDPVIIDLDQMQKV